MENTFVHTFPNKEVASAIRIHSSAEIPRALDALHVQYPSPTLVLVGGAGGIKSGEESYRLFVDALAPLAQAMNLVVIDGGTDIGIMQLMGRARSEIAATFPLVGVAAAGTIALSEAFLARPNNELLEPHHSHFVLVPGSHWGDESPWIAQIANVVAGNLPSLTLLINGGDVAWRDVLQSVKAKRPVIVVADSGRTADELVEAMHGGESDKRARQLVASNLLHAIDPSEGFDELTRSIKGMLGVQENLGA